MYKTKDMNTIKQFSTWLYSVSNVWVALAGFIIFLLFTATVLPAQAEEADKTHGDVGSPDMSFFYTPEKLYEMAEAYGEQGRANYIRVRFTFDLIWPLIYTLFLSTSISFSFGRILRPESRWRWLNLAPLFGMIFDYLENITTALVMYRFPTSTDILAFLAPIMTVTKWIFVTGSFILLLVGILVLIWQFVRTQLGKKQ